MITDHDREPFLYFYRNASPKKVQELDNWIEQIKLDARHSFERERRAKLTPEELWREDRPARIAKRVFVAWLVLAGSLPVFIVGANIHAAIDPSAYEQVQQN